MISTSLDYALLTDSDKREQLTGALYELERRHYLLTLDIEGAMRVGDEDALERYAQAASQIEGQIALGRERLETLGGVDGN